MLPRHGAPQPGDQVGGATGRAIGLGLAAVGLAVHTTAPVSCPFAMDGAEADATGDGASDQPSKEEGADAGLSSSTSVLPSEIDVTRDHWVYERERAGEPLVPTTTDRMFECACHPEFRVVLFGEEHDDVVAHRIELELYTALTAAAKDGKCTLSLEMLETDQTPDVAAFAAGTMTAEELLRWRNWTDYAPMLQHARDTASTIVPANPPRKFVSMVSKLGGVALDGLDADEKALLPPLPLDPVSDVYKSKVSKFMSAPGSQGSGPGPEQIERLCEAQNVWDATMAFNIAQAVASNAGGTGSVFHVCGRFHVEHFLGIYEHLGRALHQLREDGVIGSEKTVLNVVCIQLDSMAEFETATADPLVKHSADFVVFTLRPPPAAHEEGARGGSEVCI